MNREFQQRLLWIRLYEEPGDAGFVCRRCGISRPTLRKWWRRFRPMVKRAYTVSVNVLTRPRTPRLLLRC